MVVIQKRISGNNYLIKKVKTIKKTEYTLIKIPIKEIIKQNFDVLLDRDTEINNEYLIKQGTSPLFDQIERIKR